MDHFFSTGVARNSEKYPAVLIRENLVDSIGYHLGKLAIECESSKYLFVPQKKINIDCPNYSLTTYPSWPGGVDATSKKCRETSYYGAAGVLVLDRKMLPVEPNPPPRLRLRRSHTSWPGGAIGTVYVFYFTETAAAKAGLVSWRIPRMFARSVSVRCAKAGDLSSPVRICRKRR